MEHRYDKSVKSSKNLKRHGTLVGQGTWDERKVNHSLQEASKRVDDNGKLLLKVQVTESLCANMSTRTPSVSDSVNDEKGHVEVTIVRPINEQISANRNWDDSRKAEKSSGKDRRSLKSNAAAFTERSANRQRIDPKNSKIDSKNREKINDSSDRYFDKSGTILAEPLVELGALHDILDRLRPDDLESTSAWFSSEECCREIVKRFQNLLVEWSSDRARLENSLSIDRTLVKCETCGVIKRSQVSRCEENIGKKKKDEIMMAERENDMRFSEKVPTNALKIRKEEEIVKNRYGPFTELRRPETAIKERNNAKINRIPVPKRFPFKGKNDRQTIDRSIVEKSAKNPRNFVDKSRLIGNQFETYQKFVNNETIKNVTMEDTVKYLARGNFSLTEDPESKVFSDKTTVLEESCFRKKPMEKRDSFVLHGSRDVDFHENSNYLLIDESRSDEKKSILGLKEIDSSNASRETVNLSQSTFSSSSAENLIRQWIKPVGCNVKTRVDDSKQENENSKYEIRAGTSLKKVRSIRTQIAEAIQRFADRTTVSGEDLSGKSEIKGNKITGSLDGSSRIHSIVDPDENPSRIDSKDQELRGTSKEVSNRIWDENFVDQESISGSDSTEMVPKTITKNSTSALTVMSSRSFDFRNLSAENSERFERQILYDQVSSQETISRESLTAATSKALLIYRKILESNEEMDWASFEGLVTALHPSQRELWCDICKAVSNEAKRVADETGATTEVSIEINPQSRTERAGTVCSRDDEITFELDVTVQDARAILETSDLSATSREKRERKK